MSSTLHVGGKPPAPAIPSGWSDSSRAHSLQGAAYRNETRPRACHRPSHGVPDGPADQSAAPPIRQIHPPVYPGTQPVGVLPRQDGSSSSALHRNPKSSLALVADHKGLTSASGIPSRCPRGESHNLMSVSHYGRIRAGWLFSSEWRASRPRIAARRGWWNFALPGWPNKFRKCATSLISGIVLALEAHGRPQQRNHHYFMGVPR